MEIVQKRVVNGAIRFNMAEATEELVKIFLEQRGYLVTTSKRINAKTSKNSPRAEIDIVAIYTKDDQTQLPKRIAGEVKSYPIDARGFEELDKALRKKYNYKSRKDYQRYKWINNLEYSKQIIKALEKEYGYDDFKFVLFCGGINKKYEKEIRDFLMTKGIIVITHSEMLKWLFENRTNEYTDNQILQLIRLIKNNAKTIDF
jgi:hypothetical protein